MVMHYLAESAEEAIIEGGAYRGVVRSVLETSRRKPKPCQRSPQRLRTSTSVAHGLRTLWRVVQYTVPDGDYKKP